MNRDLKWLIGTSLRFGGASAVLHRVFGGGEGVLAVPCVRWSTVATLEKVIVGIWSAIYGAERSVTWISTGQPVCNV